MFKHENCFALQYKTKTENKEITITITTHITLYEYVYTNITQKLQNTIQCY